MAADDGTGAGTSADTSAAGDAGTSHSEANTGAPTSSSKPVAGAGRSTARGARGRLKTVLGVVGVAAVTAHIYKHKDSSNLGLNADALRESIDSVKSLWGEYVHAYFAGGGGDSKGSVDARAV